MRVGEIDPLIHVSARLRIMATLAALPVNDTLSFTRLQDMIEVSAGNLITHLRKLEDADYIRTMKTGIGASSRTQIVMTKKGRKALSDYTTMLREIIDGL